MESDLVRAAVTDSQRDLRRWAEAVWDGSRPDVAGFADRVQAVLLLSFLAGQVDTDVEEKVSTGAVELESYAQGDPWWRVNDSPETSKVFRETIQLLLRKKQLPTHLDPSKLSGRLRQISWHVANVTSNRLLHDIRSELVDSRMAGEGLSDFIDRVQNRVNTSAAHLETVYRTNIESATSAARFGQYTDPDVADMFVGYRYLAKDDARARVLHRLMDGFVALKDDPIWPTIWTPNGYNCRCKIRPVRRRDGISMGLINDKGEPLQRRLFANRTQRMVVEMAERRGTVNVGGEVLVFPDPGFRGNAMLELVA